jgi:hypothetical protein
MEGCCNMQLLQGYEFSQFDSQYELLVHKTCLRVSTYPNLHVISTFYVCIEGCDTLCRWGSAQHRRYVKGWTYFTCYDEMDIPDIPEPGDFIKSTQKWLSHFNVPSASPTSTVRIQAPQSSASNQVTNQSIKNKRTNKQTNERTNEQTNKQRNKETKNTCTEYVLLLYYFNALSLYVYIYIYSIYPQLLM